MPKFAVRICGIEGKRLTNTLVREIVPVLE